MTSRLKSEEKAEVYARSGIDRRSGTDRRQMQNLDRHIDNTTQRRSVKEQRQSDELRSGWVRISEWSSMYVGRSKGTASGS